MFSLRMLSEIQVLGSGSQEAGLLLGLPILWAATWVWNLPAGWSEVLVSRLATWCKHGVGPVSEVGERLSPVQEPLCVS